MQQLFEDVFFVEGEIGGRPLQLVYLKGRNASILLDTGCAGDPQKIIAPQLKQVGADIRDLAWILSTHPDLDHIGGNHAAKQLAPNARIVCGDADRLACTGLDTLLQHRYDIYRKDHQIFPGEATLTWMKANVGAPQLVDCTFRGGEHLRLAAGWEVEVIAVPGHAKGHLAIYDPVHRAMYGADAIHGAVYRGLDGAAKLCPTYYDLDDYLSTIQLIEHMPITTYVGCHWPVKREDQISEFCRESRVFVEKADLLLLTLLKKPHSLREICEELGPQLGDWPRSVDIELVSALEGHVRRGLERGTLRAGVRSEEPRVLEFVLR
jgi:glyoxylase-like metal-dependent hydrolase (beta-lactamase superfamily II)